MNPFLRRIPILTLLLLTSFTLASCNFPMMGPTPDTIGTFAAQTIAVRSTQQVLELTFEPPPIAATPTLTILPSSPVPSPIPATATPSVTPMPTETTIPCDRASFVTDVTVPDGTLMAPGENFIKTWRLRNNGSCTWTSGYSIIFDHGDSMSGPTSAQLTSGTVGPGQTVDVSVSLKAPSASGTYKGYWKLRNGSNVIFGIGAMADVAFWVEIQVGTPTDTPFPVLSSGSFTIVQSQFADLDTGSVGGSSPARDFEFHPMSALQKYIVPKNGARFRLMGGTAPSLAACQGASLSTNQIDFHAVSTGDWLCYETNAGNYGRFEIENKVGGVNPSMEIDYKTWDT